MGEGGHEERLAVGEEAVGQAEGNRTGRVDALDAEQVPCAPINRKEDVLNDPQVIANELIVESLHPHAGQMRQARPAARFEKTPSELLRQPAPLLGEQTNAVLSELGISPDQLAALREAGTIG